MDKFKLTCNWDCIPKEYKHFTDLGHYLIKSKDADYRDYDKVAPLLYAASDIYVKPCCTATIKKNC